MKRAIQEWSLGAALRGRELKPTPLKAEAKYQAEVRRTRIRLAIEIGGGRGFLNTHPDDSIVAGLPNA